jgi:hypothetical protein
MNDYQIAQQVDSLYAGAKGFQVYESGQGDDGICYGINVTATENEIYLRGSANLQDWIRDLMAVALTRPFEHNVFGPVHFGAFIGMDEAITKIIPLINRKLPILLSGHSLGGQRCALTNAILIQRGFDPTQIRRVVFGSPKAGYKSLLNYIAKSKVTSYWNVVELMHDPVPVLPFSFPPEDYVNDPLIHVSGNPDLETWAKLGAFGPHHMPAYVAGVSKILSGQIPIPKSIPV